MGTAVQGTNKARRRFWLLAAAASVLVHAGVLLALLQRTQLVFPEPPPAIEVALIRPDRPPAPPEPRPEVPASQAEAPITRPATDLPDRLRLRPSAPRGVPVLEAPATRPGLMAPTPSPPPAAPSSPASAGGSPGVQADGATERLRSALRSAGCLSTGRMTAEERARCAERLGAAVRRAEPPAPPKAWAARRRGDEARKQGARSLFDALPKSPTCIAGGPCQMELSGGIAFGEPPKALPNIPAHTLRGDDDALRPKPRADD